MRYRRLSYRYAMVVRSGQAWPPTDLWTREHVRVLLQPHWRPDVDTYETTSAVELIVDLAGVDESDYEVQLFEDALVVEGRRQLPSCHAGAVYQEAGIRQGPFRLEVPLPAAIDAERVEARYDRGLLRITLPKPAEGR
jgi:HSP20 family protein